MCAVVAGALVAAVFGLMDLAMIPRGTRAFRTGITHMALNLTVVALFVASFLVRRGGLDAPAVPPALIALSAVAMGLLGASGWLGGRLAYRYGVRVADEATQAEGFARDDVGARVPPPGAQRA